MQRKLGVRGRLVLVGLAWGLAWGALAGCCLSSISGLGTAGSGTGGSGSTGGTSASSAASSTGADSTSATSSATGSAAGATVGTSSGTTTSGATTSGTSTGQVAPIDTIFGPVAIAVVPGASERGAARLAYSVGDGGQFAIMLQTLAGDGGPLGDPVQVATTGVWWGSADGGGPVILYPIAPPNIAASDDGTETAICWEDYGQAWSTGGPACDSEGEEAVVRCASVPESGGTPDASYSNCGKAPSLVFNPSRGDTQLFFVDDGLSDSPIGEWAYGQEPGVSQTLSTMSSARPAGVPLAAGDGVIYTEINEDHGPQLAELFLATSAYADGAYLGDGSAVVDPAYTSLNLESCGKVPTPFVAASNPGGDTIEVLEWQQSVGCDVPPRLLQFVWQVDAGVGGTPTEIQSTVPLLGAIAVGVCPDGFENFMTTALGTVLVAKVGFDGGTGDAPSYLTLPGFNQTPGLNRDDNTGFSEPATSLAVAPAPGGKLFLAISNPWRVGVYVVDCE